MMPCSWRRCGCGRKPTFGYGRSARVRQYWLQSSGAYHNDGQGFLAGGIGRSEEHTSELQSLMRISYAVFCLKKKKKKTNSVQSILKITHHVTSTQSSLIQTKNYNNKTRQKHVKTKHRNKTANEPT